MNAEELFKLIQESRWPTSLLLKGEDAYVERELRSALKAKRWDVTFVDMPKSGPDVTLEERGSGGDLFGGSTLLWVRKAVPPTQWKEEKPWQRLLSRCDGRSLSVVLQVSEDKRLKWDAAGCEEEASLSVPPARVGAWLARMNDKHKAGLTRPQMEFLAQFGDDLQQLDNYVELWALGGELWAQRALGWGDKQSAGAAVPLPENAAFGWVDAVLAGRRKDADRLLKALLGEGEEPLRLLALLQKSVGILAMLEEGSQPRGQPEFLVGKLRPLARAGRGRRLLQRCAWLDTKFKGSPLDARAALYMLS